MKLNIFYHSLNRKRILETLIEINYLAIIFLVPLYFAYWLPTYNIFELNKLVLFKSLVWLLLFLTGLKLIFYFPAYFSNQKYYHDLGRFLKKYLTIPLIFIAGLALSLLFSIDPLKSFFGSYDRQEGLLTYLFYFLWFILLLINISSGDKDLNKKKIKRLIITAVVSSLIISLYGILQIFNIDFLKWTEQPFLTHRTISTLGQPNFLASYLLLIIPLSLYLIIKSKKLLGKFFYFLIFVAQILCLFFTASRGALFALALLFFVWLIFLLFKSALNIYRKILIIFGFLVILLASVLGLNHFFPGRLASAFNLQYGSSAVRVTFYKSALDAISKKPLFGYGLENSSEIFIKYYQPDWGVYGNVGATTDRAHNLVLDLLLSGGIFMLGLFSLLYYQFFSLVRRNLKSAGLNSISLFLGLSVAAYLISLMFSFTIISGEVYFFAYLAILISISLSKDLASADYSFPDKLILNKPRPKKINLFYYSLAVLILILITALGINRERKTLLADYYFGQIYYFLAAQKYTEFIILNNNLLAQKTNIINLSYYNQFLADKLSVFYPEINNLADKKMAGQELVKIASTLRPIGYENILALAQVSGALGDIKSSQEYFSLLKEISPAWPTTYLNEAQMFFVNGRYQEAIADYNLAISTLPAAADPRLNINNDLHRQNVLTYYYLLNREIGNCYFALNDYQQAESFYQQAYLYNQADFSLFKKIADCYFLRGDLNSALIYNQRGYERNPKDFNWPLSIAILNYDLHNLAGALEYIDQAIQLAPNNNELKNLKLEYSR